MPRKRSQMAYCESPVRITARALLSFLAFSCTTSAEAPASNGYLLNPQQPLSPPPASTPSHTAFYFRHIFHHGTQRHPDLFRKLDIPPEAAIWFSDEDDPQQYRTRLEPLPFSTEPFSIQRLSDRSPERMETLMTLGRARGRPLDLPITDWTTDSIPGPNVTDKKTIISFARMASNAYILEPHTGEWEDVGHGFNYTEDFGWESDGLRGHIFADTTNSTVVIAMKGTSPAVFDGQETTTNDKINDNLFFSCCCGQGGSVLWHQVCDCKTSTYTCNSTCLVQSLREKDRYYYAAQQLYHNVTALYPSSNIWLAGHSLGGAVSAMLGLTYGVPAITFEAPGDALPASRLGLPTPPGYRMGSADPEQSSTGGFHFGHTADPVYMGTCASCSYAGYAMESVCHTGRECRYDTVKDLGWSSYIGKHKISFVIRNVLEEYDEPAKCEVVSDCTDCFDWKYYKSNSSSPTTSKSSQTSTRHTQTRTETCKTPGWFGCLDESTTGHGKTSTSSTSSSSSTTTSSCKTPGWFGCQDETTSTSKSKSSSALTITTTSAVTSLTATHSRSHTCRTSGWFGCLDPTSSRTSKSTPMPRLTLTSGPTKTSALPTRTAAPTSSCEPHWFFGGCRRGKHGGEGFAEAL